MGAQSMDELKGVACVDGGWAFASLTLGHLLSLSYVLLRATQTANQRPHKLSLSFVCLSFLCLV